MSPLEDALSGLEVSGLKIKASTDVGPFMGQILQYSLILAGFILLAMIISAGFTLLTAAGDPKKVEAGKGRLTHAAIGFLIIFAAYWIAQILQVVFNLPILSG